MANNTLSIKEKAKRAYDEGIRVVPFKNIGTGKKDQRKSLAKYIGLRQILMKDMEEELARSIQLTNVSVQIELTSDDGSCLDQTLQNKLVEKLIKAGYTQLNSPNTTENLDQRGKLGSRIFIGTNILEVTKKDGTKIKIPHKLVLKC